MKRETFYKYYEDVIKPTALNLCNMNTNFRFIDNKDALYTSYQEQKTFLRILCNKSNHNTNQREFLLDRHKVCAAILAAINNCNLIVSLDDVDEPVNLQQFNKINVQFSIAVALKLLSLFIVSDDELDEEYKLCFSSATYCFPETTSTNEQYEDTLIRTIALSKYTNHLDLPCIAHILFLLEKFHAYKCYKDNNI